MPNRIRVLIVDDHRVFAEALMRAMEHERDIEVVGKPVLSGEEAVDAVAEHEPDIVLMDLRLAGIDGVEATRRIKKSRPRTRVVILTAETGQGPLAAAVEAGVSGYLSKSAALGELIEAVRAAADGEILVPSRTSLPHVLSSVAPADPTERDRLARLLTPREVEVLTMLAAGLQSKDIARRLVLSPRTIDTHIHNLLTKFGVHSKLEAVVAGLRSGLVDLPTRTGSSAQE